ncbi:hypothetical protein GCM10010412_074890 [Nonomuraea recticatena]|uniref:Uncharacterized protein n=1 Tax=Nonomuraea recticatena TaxID=46178 RepID=A0ABN3SXH3_9ACTN
MDSWAEWNDPVELRIRLDLALMEIAELREENERLRGLLATGNSRQSSPPVAQQSSPSQTAGSGLPYADASSTPTQKLALFRTLFVSLTSRSAPTTSWTITDSSWSTSVTPSARPRPKPRSGKCGWSAG